MLGTNGAAVLMFAHGISIALLFALAGEIRQRTGTLLFSDLGGLGKVMPFAGLAFGLAAFASIGLPGLRQFRRGSDGLLRRVPQRSEPGTAFTIFQIATVLALWGVVISAVYMLRAYRSVFMGELMPESLRGWSALDGSVRRAAHPDYPARRGLAHRRILSATPSCAVLRPTFATPFMSTNR